jgi:Zn-dependent protease
MFPNMIEETPYDLRWRMFGIHVRVHPLFWLVGAILSWRELDHGGILNILLSMGCIFVSILIHELGHVVVGRWFGAHGHIVLWAFGGLAIGSNQSDRKWQRIAVSAAGPLAQFILFGLVWLSLPYWPLADGFELLSWYFPEHTRGPFHPLVATFLDTMLFVNFYWPILNLLPIWPLDGGQISREIFTAASPRNGVRLSLQLSMGVAGLLALHALLRHTTGRGIDWLPSGIQSAIFFAMFVAISFQALQMEHQQDNWLDDHRWN